MKRSIKYLIIFILSFIEGFCLYYCDISTGGNWYVIIATIFVFSLLITFLAD